MTHLMTTLGPRSAGELGMILPHEHVFVDLRTPDQPGHGMADPDDVVRLMAPELARAQTAGVTAIVECGPIGVGRRADILLATSVARYWPGQTACSPRMTGRSVVSWTRTRMPSTQFRQLPASLGILPAMYPSPLIASSAPWLTRERG